MAKIQAKSGGNSQIRVVMVEANLAEGELAQLIPALQNALRGPAPTTVIKRIAAPSLQANGGADTAEPEVIDETVTEEEAEAAPANDAPRRQPRRSNVRVPKVDPNLDMNSEVSLATFAQGKQASTNVQKYMIAAAWLKECRSIDTVTPDQIYTCFRKLDWSTSIADFGQPLRDLKAKYQYFDKSKPGYEINHLGLDFVKNLSGST